MEEMWRRGEARVHDVLEALNRGRKQRAYTTVMTVMARLYSKGMLGRRRVGKSDTYSVRISRDDYMNRRAQANVGALVEEFGDLALAHFARQVETLDAKRLRELRRLAGDD